MNRPGSVGFVVLLILALVTGVLRTDRVGRHWVRFAISDGAGSDRDAIRDDGRPTTGARSLPRKRRTSTRRRSRSPSTNGSATWTFRYERLFANDDNATAARENFGAFAEEFRK